MFSRLELLRLFPDYYRAQVKLSLVLVVELFFSVAVLTRDSQVRQLELARCFEFESVEVRQVRFAQ